MAKEPKKDALANWDEELAKAANVAAKMEASTQSASFFSLRGGILSFNDSPIPGNQMAVVIADYGLENVYYEGGYDPDEAQPPACFALQTGAQCAAEEVLKPHETVKTPQNETCEGCPQNEWGTADKGKGKACKNRRRLAVLMAGKFNDNTGKFEPILDPEHYEKAQLALLKLPVTSVKAFSALVKQLKDSMGRPPFGVFTKIKVVPDPKSQFKVTLDVIDKVPNVLGAAIMKKHAEAQSLLLAPYNTEEADGSKQATGKGSKGKDKKAARKY